MIGRTFDEGDDQDGKEYLPHDEAGRRHQLSGELLDE